MEMTHVWALAVILFGVALAATLKAVEYRRELKMADEELSRLRQEMDALKQQHDQAISDAQTAYAAEIEELTAKLAELERQRKIQFAKPIKYPDLKLR